jgi:hypothetical protein
VTTSTTSTTPRRRPDVRNPSRAWQLNVRISLAERDALNALAVANGTTVSELIRHSVRTITAGAAQ